MVNFCNLISLNADHFVLALIDPLIQEMVSYLHVFPLILQASHDHYLNKMPPAWHSLNQLVLLSYLFVLFHHDLPNLF
jgi:hypothetical protein